MTVTENSTLSDLRVEVAVLKQEVSFINKLFKKLDSVIEKIDSQHDSLIDKTTKIEANLIYTKEELSELYVSLEQTERGISDRINAIEKLLSSEIYNLNHDLGDRIAKQEEKTSELFQTKWLLWGGAAVVLWAISNFETVKKAFMLH
jgi:chromosome segregation ATPase